ncbi:MAG: hypothetical protein PVF89_01325 [Lysobacterales bacterium]
MADIILELRKRRVLPAVGVYAAGCWVLIEILDRLVQRYLLSPYLTDIVFWGLYSLIPAVMLVAWTHGKPGKDEITRLEKIGVPINLIATLGLLLTVFGDKNLNMAATRVTVNNELGQQETHYIPSEMYRRRMAVFFWDNDSGKPDLDWLRYGVTELLVQDLQQNPFVLASSPWNNFSNGFYARMRQAGYDDGLGVPRSLMREIAAEANRQYFIEGALNSQSGEYQLTARIWDSRTLTKLAELEAHGWDIYTAVDKLSEDIRKALGVPAASKHMVEDMPLAETFGKSRDAFKAYLRGLNARLFENDFDASNAYLDQATRIDPNFVLGWYVKAINLVDAGKLPAAQEALAKAEALDYRLPSRDRAQLRFLHYRLAGENEKMMSFLQMQARIHDDATSHGRLAAMYALGGELEAAKKEYLESLARDPLNVGIYLQLSNLERASGDLQAAVQYARQYQQEKPEDIDAHLQLGDLLRDSGDLEAAREEYTQAQVLQNLPVRPTVSLALLLAREGDINRARESLEQADVYARTPGEKVIVSNGACHLAVRLGKIRESIRLLHEREQYLRQSQSPLEVTLGVYGPLISYYLLLDDVKAARSALATAQSELQAPMDRFLAFAEAVVLAREDNFEAAEAALQRGREIIQQFKLNSIAFQVPLVNAKIAKARGDDEATARYYLEALALLEKSTIGGELQMATPMLYAEVAAAQVRSGQLEAAQQSLQRGFQLDPSEPMLWLARARLQQAQQLGRMAIASANYALAVWADADDDYIMAEQARALAAELDKQSG